MAAPQAITVDFDATFLVQAGLFVAFTLVLKPLLLDPMLALFEEREKRTMGAKLAARKIDEKSASALATYEAAMAKARAEANSERDKIRAEGARREQEILAKVREVTTKAISDGKQSAHAEAEKAKASLQAQIALLGQDLARRVLGREVEP